MVSAVTNCSSEEGSICTNCVGGYLEQADPYVEQYKSNVAAQVKTKYEEEARRFERPMRQWLRFLYSQEARETHLRHSIDRWVKKGGLRNPYGFTGLGRYCAIQIATEQRMGHRLTPTEAVTALNADVARIQAAQQAQLQQAMTLAAAAAMVQLHNIERNTRAR